jgi:hypothetical protein
MMESTIVSEGIARRVQSLRALDWQDTALAHHATNRLLEGIATDKAFFGALVRRLPHDDDNLLKCEKDYNIEKYVLFSDRESGARLRLHVMRPRDEGIPHSHRMDFASYILRGSYEHTVYGPLDDGTRLLEAGQIFPLKIGVESAGAGYFISHQLIHNVRVRGDECISLMLRSPYRKNRAIQYDIAKGRTYWRYGSDSRTEDSLLNCEPIDRSDVEQLIGKLEDRNLI